MPSGAAAVRRVGKRGVSWAVKWTDAGGRQCWETLGREPEWNEAKAQRELGKRLEQVEREQWRKPGGVTFSAFADRFTSDYLPGRNLKPSTDADYRSIINGRLIPFFGSTDVARIDAIAVDAYISYATAAGMAPKTVKNHLALLRVMFKVARRWRLVHANPVDEAEMPRVDVPEMSILTETEIASLLTTYRRLEQDADGDAEWWRLARHVVEFALGTAMRRGEIIGLRWRDVELLERRLHVRETIVRGKVVTPKSRSSRRTMEIGPRTGRTLDEVWQTSCYRTDDSFVFGHPQKGTPVDPTKLSRDYMRPALKAAGISKPFRPWHDLRHTALTHEAAAGNPHAYVQAKAGHSQSTITDRYIHAAQVLFPGAAEKAEERMFGVAG
jgi:integrase